MTAAELLYGALRSRAPETAMAAVREFLSLFEVLGTSGRTTEVYARLRRDIASAGRPIPANVLWLASLAVEHEAVLVTDDAHFDVLPGLSRENWLEA